MKNQHTPGPWIFTGNAGQVFAFNSRKVADCGNCGMSKENASNAHLIASAPDLLHALDLLLNKLNAHGIKNKHLVDAIEKAESAISKAKGESK